MPNVPALLIITLALAVAGCLPDRKSTAQLQSEADATANATEDGLTEDAVHDSGENAGDTDDAVAPDILVDAEDAKEAEDSSDSVGDAGPTDVLPDVDLVDAAPSDVGDGDALPDVADAAGAADGQDVPDVVSDAANADASIADVTPTPTGFTSSGGLSRLPSASNPASFSVVDHGFTPAAACAGPYCFIGGISP